MLLQTIISALFSFILLWSYSRGTNAHIQALYKRIAKLNDSINSVSNTTVRGSCLRSINERLNKLERKS